MHCFTQCHCSKITTINVSRLHPYKLPTILGQQIMPQSPVEVEGEEEYVVEEILDSHLRCSKLEFLVKWEGYTNENNLWEPEDNCKNTCNAIAAFYCKYPQVPRQIAWMQFNNLNFWPYPNFTLPNTLIVSHLEVEVSKGGNVRKTSKLKFLFFFIYFHPVEPKHNSKHSEQSWEL